MSFTWYTINTINTVNTHLKHVNNKHVSFCNYNSLLDIGAVGKDL